MTRQGLTLPPDPESPDTNVIVMIDGNCTGILITPQIVLTANHCIYGAETLGNCAPKTPGTIRIGLNAPLDVTSLVKIPYVDGESMTNACLLAGEQANDIGVLYMSTPVQGSSFKNPEEPLAPRIVQPSLLGPLDAGFAADGGTFGVAGYGGGSLVRRSGVLQAPPAHGLLLGGNDTWFVSPSGWDTEQGDSGGPLFYRHPNGRLDVLGVLTGHDSGGSIVWPAVTSGLNRAWLLNHVRESNVPVALQHKASWLTRHGKTGSSWWGELDYSGPCQLNVDRDCDGWWDHGVAANLIHDNCTNLANPDQVDTNEDGIGDLCQACPFSALNGDADGDGVCSKGPSTPDLYKWDNCPTVSNANQANCNEEAERVRRGNFTIPETLGDACDPVPCPATKPVVTGEYRNPVGGGHPQFGGFFSGRIISDAISTVRVAPHVKQPQGSASVKASLPDVLTYARFCQQRLPDYRCRADQNIRDNALNDYSSSAAELEADPAKPWHRVALSVNAQNRDAGWHWPYDDTLALVNHTWSYAADWTFWTSGARIPPAGGLYAGVCSATSLVGPGTCLDGALWYHAESTVGDATHGVANGTNVGVHGNGLANHYFDVRPDGAYARTYAGIGLMRQFFFLIKTLPDPAPYETVLRSRMRPLVAAGNELDTPMIVEDHGGSYDASAVIHPYLLASLQFPGVVWTSAIEPPGVATNLDDRIQAVGVGRYGDLVYDTVLYEDGILKSGSDQTPNASSTGNGGQPSPRTGFLPILSKNVGGVFIIGGLDTTTGQELHDVHLWRPQVGWSTIVPSIAFAKAKAATFSPADKQLWILEQRNSSYSLFRMSPWTGVTQALGTWTRGTTWDQHFLAVDRDGQVLLVASSRTNQQSKFAKLRVNATGGAYASQIDQDTIPYTTSAPLVDADEYGLIVRDDTGAVTSVFRRTNLLGATGTFSLSGFFQ